MIFNNYNNILLFVKEKFYFVKKIICIKFLNLIWNRRDTAISFRTDINPNPSSPETTLIC
jgi:hypothetical protein